MFLPESHGPKWHWYGFITSQVFKLLDKVLLWRAKRWWIHPGWGDPDNPMNWRLCKEPVFFRYYFPIIKAVFPNGLLEKIIRVQPMGVQSL